MSVPLIVQKGSWHAVCEHVAGGLGARLKDKKDYIDWMMLLEGLSPSGYRNGLWCDSELYFHAYSIYKKLRSGKNQHHIALISGKIGKGKSTLACQLAAMIDPTFCMDRVCYVPPHLFRRLSNCNPFEANNVDEGGNFFKSRNSMTQLGRDIAQAMQLVRDLQQLLIVCYDEPEKLDKEILDKVDTMLVKTYDPSEPSEERKYRGYWGFGATAFSLAKEEMKKKKSVFHKDVCEFRQWEGHNSTEMPIINDFHEEIYRSEKRKYLREHMAVLEQKYAKEYEGLDKGVPEKHYKLSEAAEMLGKSQDYLNELCRKGKIPEAKKIGKLWTLPLSYILAQQCSKPGKKHHISRKSRSVENLDNTNAQRSCAEDKE
jgi:hypothetical protein